MAEHEKPDLTKVVKDGNTMPIDKLPMDQLPVGALEPEISQYLASTSARYDIETFVREQAEFIKAQTRFLGLAQSSGALSTNGEYAQALTGYSLAQDRYVRALTRVLEQVRVL